MNRLIEFFVFFPFYSRLFNHCFLLPISFKLIHYDDDGNFIFMIFIPFVCTDLDIILGRRRCCCCCCRSLLGKNFFCRCLIAFSNSYFFSPNENKSIDRSINQLLIHVTILSLFIRIYGHVSHILKNDNQQ